MAICPPDNCFPLRRMQFFIMRNDLLWAITIASLYCSVLKVHFCYFLHPRADGTMQSCLFLLLGSLYFIFNYVKAN